MKVLVFGATGFIGNPTAKAFARAGHDVIAVTRSQNSAAKLQQDELEPHVCDPFKVEDWKHLIYDVDVVVDCSSADDLKGIGMTILDTTIEQSKATRPNGPPLAYIYCSGTWVHGNDNKLIQSDRTPIRHPGQLTSWRLEIEQKALKASSISFAPNVVRPSMLYGYSASIFGMTFEAAAQGTATWYGSVDDRIATIHTEDLANAFVAVAEHSPVSKEIIFDISNDYPESIWEIMQQLKRVSGASEVKFEEPSTPLQKAIASSDVLRPTLAKSILGWRPQKPPLAQGMESYYKSWAAYKQK